jgi:hypothetical protein
VVDELKKRAPMIWEIPFEAGEWKDGAAVPAGANAGAFDPLDMGTKIRAHRGAKSTPKYR